MSELNFKTSFIRKEYKDFKRVRSILIEEFSVYNIDKRDLCEIVDLVDQMCIKFLTEKTPSYEDIINEFRELTFKLIDQRNIIEKEDN